MIDEKKLLDELIKCKDLGRKSFESVLRVINEQPKVGEWIPCSERLPKAEEEVSEKMKELWERKKAARIQETRAPLTARQKQIFDFIVEYTKKNCFPPSVREIGEGVGLASTSSVHFCLKVLQEKGYIETKEMQPRAIRIIGYRYEEG